LALVEEVIDSVDEPLEHVESEEGVVAWLGPDSEWVLELVREESPPTLSALSHRDQRKEPSRAARIDFEAPAWASLVIETVFE